MSRHEDLRVYSMGLMYASVCTSLADDEVVKRMNELHPTGLDHGWRISNDAEFRDGTPNPCTCHESSYRRHVLMEC